MEIIVKQSFPNAYVFAILASLVAGFVCAGIVLAKEKVSGLFIFLSIFANIIFTMYFGAMFSVVTSLIVEHKLGCGLSSLGGVIGMFLGILLLKIVFKNEELPLMKGYVLALSLMYGVSKIGCLLSGCCNGREYHGFGSIQYIGEASHIRPYPVFPVPLVESVVFLIIFIIFAINYKRVKTEEMLIVYSVSKFALDFLRESHVGQILSVNQIVCIIIAIVSIIILYRRNRTCGSETSDT